MIWWGKEVRHLHSVWETPSCSQWGLRGKEIRKPQTVPLKMPFQLLLPPSCDASRGWQKQSQESQTSSLLASDDKQIDSSLVVVSLWVVEQRKGNHLRYYLNFYAPKGSEETLARPVCTPPLLDSSSVFAVMEGVAGSSDINRVESISGLAAKIKVSRSLLNEPD